MTEDPEKRYVCDECGEAFESQVAWEFHNRKIHFRYTCQNCRELFETESELEAHNQIHAGLKKSSVNE